MNANFTFGLAGRYKIGNYVCVCVFFLYANMMYDSETVNDG